ncbi:MAG: DNA primase [Synergistaceae bacterium]|jgi:DNA primase|nr:DNA primase [Synergistaceae bacterium]
MGDDVSEIKSRIDIVELIGDYVHLRKTGSTHWGLCPFHGEKTPSFAVSSERGTFHCFGCNKGGNIFTFVMEMEGLSFREALETLAARAGVRLSGGRRASQRGVGEKKDERAILEAACKFFRQALKGPGGSAAMAYLSRRGVGDNECSLFELGWAPQSWDGMSKHLRSLGYSIDDAISSGLAVRGERGTYDRFRGRIIFPIRDRMAKITGFGGRLIDGEGAKYINSPESALFSKRHNLYLMHEAKKNIRERGRVILMEGYMDAIRAHLSGFTETVASLGTSLTDEQAKLIKSIGDLCYVAYDADGAGQEASIRGMYILNRHGIEVKVVALPEGMDPDDMLSKSGGGEKFGSLLDSAMPLPLYHVHARRHDLNTPGRALKAREEVFSSLASLPWLDVRSHIPKIAVVFALKQHEVEDEIQSHKKRERASSYDEDISGRSDVFMGMGGRTASQRNKELDLECAFCSLIWSDEALRTELACSMEGPELLQLFSDEATSGVVAALVSGENPNELEERWRHIGERDLPSRITRGDAVLAWGELGARHIDKIIDSLRVNMARRRYETLKPLVLSERATRNDIAEYHRWAKKLKGGGGS